MNPSGPLARRLPDRPRAWVVDCLMALAGLGLAIVLLLWIMAESSGALRAAGGIETAAGRLAGLVAAYTLIVVVLLSARIPPLERALGHDRLIGWHRRLAPWALYLLLAHGTLIVIGYAAADHRGIAHELWLLISTYPGILASLAGSILLFSAGVSSYRRARSRLRYETWWAAHLYVYLALLFAFFHQVDNGASFVGHPLARAYWTALWLGTMATIAGFRILLPLSRSFRHRLRVVEVRQETADTWSVLIGGRALDRLPAVGGQFIQWRFLRRGLWWQAHPYSLSAAPRPGGLRITVNAQGDFGRAVADLRPGTMVAFEGPYGVFTPDSAQRRQALLIGAGVGVTPIRALLEDLPRDTDVTVILRASEHSRVILRDEFAELLSARSGRLIELVGPRDEVRLNSRTLRGIVPDIGRRDVFICGPDGFARSVELAARGASVPDAQIHVESFAF